MRNIIIKLASVMLLSGLSVGAFANPTDSAEITPPDVDPASQPTLLAQGVVQSNPGANNAPIFPVQVMQHCGQNTRPLFESSLVGTYENSFYATGGIVNGLYLTPDYKITGIIYMSNRGAVGANNYSSVTMNWQIWCTPTKTA